ncbi:MAG: 1-acyl-sn-glycerol-3-phosphate acyltransferase [Proteobacteria bacterium]|nr:1-acyl-sn-glycerol-3-phosphate acyltransferase [Pseudomonadota bacterium]
MESPLHALEQAYRVAAEPVHDSAQKAPASVTPGKPYAPNPTLRWFYDRFFSHIEVDESWSAAVRDAAARGTVVYVMRSISFLDFLCLDYLVKQLNLPLVRFANDLGLWLLEPFGKGRRRWLRRRQIPEDRALRATLLDEHSALIFLRRPPGFARRPRRGERLDLDLIRVLVATQRASDRPILLVPQTFVWHKLPRGGPNTLLDLVFGPSEWPGRVRVLLQFLRNYRHALLRSGEAFDLRDFLSSHHELSDQQAADKIRWAMLRRIERERTIVLGPRKKTPERLREELLRSPRLRGQLAAVSRANPPSQGTMAEAEKILRKLAAAPDPLVLALWHRALDYVWNRLYHGMEIDRDGLRRIREASRHGTLILLPTHKSHVDYLVLSDLFYSNDLWPPLVAAGDNLGFWPLGVVLRRAGAFFIRRSIKGQRLYSIVLESYVRKLLQEGFTIELFMEGGRSRTGQMLPPKLGLVSMIVDAALGLRARRVFFVPISIGYESVIEERAYLDELSGKEKVRENLAGLVRSSRLLRSDYGRLYVQFGEIVELADSVRAVAGLPAGAAAPTSLSPKQRRTLVQSITHRAMHEIQRVTVVTPASLVAAALLSHRRRAMAHRELVFTASRLLQSAQRFGARMTDPVTNADGNLNQRAVEEAVSLFTRRRLLVRAGLGQAARYRVPDDKRIVLEYYKNNILHFYTANALLATAMRAARAEPVQEATLERRFLLLCDIFRYESVAPPDQAPSERFRVTLDQTLARGEAERQGQLLRPGAGQAGAALELHAELLRSYLESYRLTLQACRLLLEGDMTKKEWLRRTLALGEKSHLAGELECREALSRIKLDNALKALHDQGVLRMRSGGVLQLALGSNAADDLQQHEDAVARFLV